MESYRNVLKELVKLRADEWIFWPYEDVQFYIREEDEKVHVTGIKEMFRKILGN